MPELSGCGKKVYSWRAWSFFLLLVTLGTGCERELAEDGSNKIIMHFRRATRCLGWEPQSLAFLGPYDLRLQYVSFIATAACSLLCTRPSAKTPANLVRYVDLNTQLLSPCPHQSWVLLEHAAGNDHVQPIIQQVVCLLALGD